MKKIFIISCLFVTIAGKAQMKGFSLGPYLEAGWPVGNLQETNKNGIGAGLGADIRLGKLGLTGSAGYMRFGGKRIDIGDGQTKMPAISAIPIRVGIKYRMFPSVYAKLESGVAKFTGGDESALIISPGIAVRLLGFELQGKYEIWNRNESLSFWGLKAGINF